MFHPTRLWFILGDVNAPKHADPRPRQFFCSFLRASRSFLSFLSPALIPAAIPPLAITLSLALALAISLKACVPSDGSTAATAASTSAAAPSSVMRTPIAIPPRATIDEAWSIIGTAIVDNDTLTFRAYSTPEVYSLVVRPRDINGTQAVVITSHWDIIAGRRTGFYEDSHDLPKTPAPGECIRGKPPYELEDIPQVDYTCIFTSDGETPNARFFLSKVDGSWIVVGFSGLYN